MTDVFAPPPRRLCINCDNRHGCRSGEPPCLKLPRTPDERRLTGRALMQRRGLLHRCPDCPHFRRCWSGEEFRRAIQASEPPKTSQ